MKTHIPLIVSALLLLPQLVKAQGNLVINGGFDTDASGWAKTNVFGSGYLSSGGNPGGCFSLINSPLYVPTISQEINGLIPGQVYIVSGDYKSGGKGYAADSFGVALDGNIVFIANSPPDYQWYGFSFKYAATSTSALLSVSAQLNGTGYSYAIDNIVMQPIPSVAVRFSGTNVVLSWPTNAQGFTLQSATNLPVASWADVTNVPAIVGTNYSVTLSSVQQVELFSLKR